MGQGFESLQARQHAVGVVQWLERQIVALEVVGSTPITHPILLLLRAVGGVSPSGKARDFDSRTRRFDPCHPSQTGVGLKARPVFCISFRALPSARSRSGLFGQGLEKRLPLAGQFQYTAVSGLPGSGSILRRASMRQDRLIGKSGA